MSEYLQRNRKLWDGWTGIHSGSRFYDVAAFRAGASTLKPIELDAVGDVTGLELLHLQCHFGLDTLSWARLGARVTGVDFSPRAVELAQSLAAELGIDATFHCGDVLELPAEWSERFDLAFTSYGVLPWLPALGPWAEGIARALKPGGSFHIVEFHPLATMLDDDGRSLRHPYFHSTRPEHYTVRGSYADPDATFTHDAYEWSWGLAEVYTALAAAGLAVQTFTEYDYSPYDCFPYLEQREPGRFAVRGAAVPLPLVFSMHAVR